MWCYSRAVLVVYLGNPRQRPARAPTQAVNSTAFAAYRAEASLVGWEGNAWVVPQRGGIVVNSGIRADAPSKRQCKQ